MRSGPLTFGSRKFRGLIALVAILIFGAFYVYNEWEIRNQAWQGTVVEKWKKESRRWSLSNSPGKRPRRHHYLRVKLSDGKIMQVKVQGNLYDDANIGTSVTKRTSERYPVLVK